MNGKLIAGIVIGVILAAILSFILNITHKKKYGESAVQPLPCFFQTVFLAATCIFLICENNVGWIICGILTVISYAIAIVSCKKNAEEYVYNKNDLVIAVAAQILFPIGIIAIVLVLSNNNNNRNRRY